MLKENVGDHARMNNEQTITNSIYSGAIMIWTAITYSVSQEKIEYTILEAPMDFDKAYTIASSESDNIVLSLVKGNHQGAIYIPNLDVKLTRCGRSNYLGEF